MSPLGSMDVRNRPPWRSRIRRVVHSAVVGGTVVMSIAAAVLGLYSRRYADQLIFYRGRDYLTFWSEHGQVAVAWQQYTTLDESACSPNLRVAFCRGRASPNEECHPSNFPANPIAGFDFSTTPWTNCGGATRVLFVGVPHALLAAVLAIWPFARMMHGRRIASRRKRGLCLTCGYDLRAHAAGQRCPECGTRVPERTVTAERGRDRHSPV